MTKCGAAVVWHVCTNVSCVINALDEWQTMVTGLLAVAAAWLALRAAKGQLEIAKGQLATAKRQLDDQREQADRDRAGRLRAARAALPAVLSSICAYAEEAALSSNGQWPASTVMYPADIRPDAEFQVTLNVPAFPSSTLPVLERLVELSDDNDISKAIEALLREVQVFTARTDKLRKGEALNPYRLSEIILQAVVIYARTETLYGYARRQADGVDPKPLWERVFGVLFLLDLDRDERIVGLARRQRDQGMPPGDADTLPDVVPIPIELPDEVKPR